MTITIAPFYSSPSSQDPSGLSGFTGAGSIWAHTDDGLWLSRDSGNTHWNIIGSGDQGAFGLYPLTGGSTSGAVSGANGIMTADGNTPFAVPPTITSKSSVMATMVDLYNLQQAVGTLVAESVQNAIASIVVPGIRSNMAIAVFQYTANQSSPSNVVTIQPTSQGIGANIANFNLVYPDNSQVSASDCIGYATQAAYYTANGGNLVQTQFIHSGAAGMAWQSYSYNAATPVNAGFTFMIIAIKKGA